MDTQAMQEAKDALEICIDAVRQSDDTEPVNAQSTSVKKFIKSNVWNREKRWHDTFLYTWYLIKFVWYGRKYTRALAKSTALQSKIGAMERFALVWVRNPFSLFDAAMKFSDGKYRPTIGGTIYGVPSTSIFDRVDTDIDEPHLYYTGGTAEMREEMERDAEENKKRAEERITRQNLFVEKHRAMKDNMNDDILAPEVKDRMVEFAKAERKDVIDELSKKD